MAAVGMAVLLVLGGPSVRPAGAAPTPVSCLAGIRVVRSCPSILVLVTLAVRDDTIVLTITNASGRTWRGGPVAAELPAPGAATTTPRGTLPGRSASGWRTIAGVVVAHCDFVDPGSRGLAAAASTSCALPRLGLPEGEHTIWLTGFRNGIANGLTTLGAVPAALGVVPVATARSVRFEVVGGRAKVLPSAPIDPESPPVQVVQPGEPSPTTVLARPGSTGSPGSGQRLLVIPLLVLVGAAAIAVIRKRVRTRRS